ncbi:MAG TPA: NAD(P)-dependent oxidoreductase [Terriglobia bacterium]|nr:NAD(P)-dependent oxidoreductase [Terriglobia bacterium]
MQIGWIGLGQMGLPMAQNALKAGHQLTVYNRTRGKAEELGKLGAQVVKTAAEAAAGDLVVTMLSDDAATEEVIFGAGNVLAALSRGGTHISMSTISVALAKRLTEAHRAAGQVYISSPVFGRPEAAAAKKLFVVPAGPPDALARLQPIFDAVGQATFIMGDEPMAANVIKLSGNFLIAAMIESLGEAMTLVRKYGVDPKRYFEMITSSLFNAPVYKTYGSLIASDNYQPVGFKMALGLKDIRLVQAAADAVAAPMPVANVVRDRMLSGVARGHQNDDWSSFARLIAEEAGL